jgi:hypothetical protein
MPGEAIKIGVQHILFLGDCATYNEINKIAFHFSAFLPTADVKLIVE